MARQRLDCVRLSAALASDRREFSASAVASASPKAAMNRPHSKRFADLCALMSSPIAGARSNFRLGVATGEGSDRFDDVLAFVKHGVDFVDNGGDDPEPLR